MSADAGSGSSDKKPLESQEWRDLAEKASKEQDLSKLIKLLETLCEKLDAHIKEVMRTSRQNVNSERNCG